jgi:hypothetical protein
LHRYRTQQKLRLFTEKIGGHMPKTKQRKD